MRYHGAEGHILRIVGVDLLALLIERGRRQARLPRLLQLLGAPEVLMAAELVVGRRHGAGEAGPEALPRPGMGSRTALCWLWTRSPAADFLSCGVTSTPSAATSPATQRLLKLKCSTAWQQSNACERKPVSEVQRWPPCFSGALHARHERLALRTIEASWSAALLALHSRHLPPTPGRGDGHDSPPLSPQQPPATTPPSGKTARQRRGACEKKTCSNRRSGSSSRASPGVRITALCPTCYATPGISRRL